jgi:hypothetical protein
MRHRHDERSRRRQVLRRRSHERAFIFDEKLARCLGTADLESWEFAISMSGGNVARAARQCGIDGVPDGAKALWGRSAEEALGTYRRWRNKSNS